MNRYRFEDLEIGLKESFTVTVTEEMMRDFLSISGDINPLHNDEGFAKEQEEENGHSVWTLDVKEYINKNEVIEVNDD